MYFRRSNYTFICILLSITPLWAKTYSLYVSPSGNDAAAGNSPQSTLLTVRKAIEQARSVNDRPVTIFLRNGEYPMTEPLAFEPADSRTAENPLTIKPFENEKPILSGGRRISNWQKQEAGIWIAQIPEVKNGDWYFTQLFVNGQRRQRARIPNEGFLRVAGFPDGGRDVHYHTDCQRFEYKPGDIDPNWANIDDVDVIVYHF